MSADSRVPASDAPAPPRESVIRYKCVHEHGGARVVKCMYGCNDAPEVTAPHPESYCHNCGGPNIVWFAPNDVWNRVMPDDGGILCPICFVRAAERKGLSTVWRLTPERA